MMQAQQMEPSQNEQVRPATPTNRRPTGFKLLVLSLLLVGLGIRIFGAWAYQHEPHYDRGRPALMAKHMAEGRDFPVFGYGAAYLGSLEPATSALMCLILGPTGFAVNMGTAVWGFLLLPFVYLWGRSAAGRSGGLIALAYCTVGPFGYYIFGVLPRGGYAATVTLSAMILWLTGKTVRRETGNRTPQSRWYWALGIAGGLAWWTNQLTTAALLTAAIWIAGSLRFRVFKRRVFIAAGCFMLASAPWWLWNAFNRWETFSFGSSFGHTSFRHGLKLFFWDRLFGLINMPAQWGVARFSIPLLLALAALLTLGVLAQSLMRRQSSERWIFQGLALSFVVVSAVLFAGSSLALVNSARYAVPLVPAIGVLAGCAIAALQTRFRPRLRWIAWLPLAILLTGQALAFRYEFGTRPDSARWNNALAIGRFCQDEQVDVLYADVWDSWMNFASGEKATVCEWSAEPYAPYEKAAEGAAAPGIINDKAFLEPFLRSTQASAAVTNIGPYRILYDCGPPPSPARPIPRSDVAAVEDSSGGDAADLVLDGNCDSHWKARVTPDGDRSLVCRFGHPTPVSEIRLWCRGEAYPAVCAVEGETATGGPWHPLLAPVRSSPYFWSGPRWYINGLFYRMAYRVDPATPLTALRLRFPAHAAWAYDIELAELQILTPTEAASPRTWPGQVPQLVQALTERNITRCYADRWLSGQIHQRTQGGVTTVRPTFMKRNIYSGRAPIMNEYRDLTSLAPHDAFVVPRPEADALQAMLHNQGLVMQRVAIGPWSLFYFGPDQYDPQSAGTLTLKWVGFGCFATTPHG
jgi:4-amino-4-deoxy-L-arabinose transferase-like glycosyltransferase